MTKRQLAIIILIAFFVGAVGSIFFDRAFIPWLSSIPGLSFLGKLSGDAPIVITRREEIRLNEGANLIELTKQAQNFVVSIYTGKGPDFKLLGNGIIMTNDGLIFTSREVVDNLKEFQIVLNDGRTFPGTLRALDPKTELVAITIPGSGLATAAFADASDLNTAQRVLALGKTGQIYTRRFASGLVTSTVANDVALGQVFAAETISQTLATDANLNADFAGSPVINLEGKLVGMIVLSNGKILISEAIQPALRIYLEQGKILRPVFGFKYQNVTRPLANLRKTDAGALVTEVDALSPAGKANLMKSDLIVEVNGSKVEDSSLEQLLLKSNSKVQFRILRDNKEIELTIHPELK